MSGNEYSKFHDVISKLIIDRTQIFFDRSPTRAVCTEIYQSIFNVITDVFDKSGAGITNEMMNYIAQSYYDAITLNGKEDQELDPNIFEKRAKLENIDTKGLAFLALLFKGTDFAVPVLHAIKKRN
jgi:hypothetical protein